MKTKILYLTLTLLLLFSAFLCFGCKKEEVPTTIWDTAVQKEDATLGEGAKTVSVKIEAGDKSITLTMSTYLAILRGNDGIAAAFATILTVVTILSLLLYLKISKSEDVRL